MSDKLKFLRNIPWNLQGTFSQLRNEFIFLATSFSTQIFNAKLQFVCNVNHHILNPLAKTLWHQGAENIV